MNKYIKKAINRYITLNTRISRKFNTDVVAVGWIKCNNFGDQLTPEVFRYFGLVPRNEPRWEFADVIGLGSILQNVPHDYSGVILGAGLMGDTQHPGFSNAKVNLIRGCLTRERINAPNETMLGDPGLLVSEIYQNEITDLKKQYVVGIVPHYQHAADQALLSFLAKFGQNIKIIDVLNHPKQVVSEIASCEYIFSSSLHGLIVADSLGIPNRWLVFSTELGGGQFKFHDYYSVYGRQETPIGLAEIQSVDELTSLANRIPTHLIEESKQNIEKAFRAYLQAR